MKNASAIRTLLIVLVVCCAVRAQISADKSIRVSLRGNLLRLEIQHPANLSAALDALCSAARASCDLSALPTSKQIAPLSISGAWDEVVGRLLEGAGVNYVAIGASAGYQPRLIVTLEGPKTTPEQTSQVGFRSSETPAIETNVMTAPAGAIFEPQSLNSAETQPVNSAEQQPTATVEPVASAGAPEGMNELPFMGPGGQSLFAPKADPYAPVQMPFAGPEGQISVPRAGSGELYLPFPDANGNMIPAPPQSNDVHMIVAGPNGFQEIVSPGPQ